MDTAVVWHDMRPRGMSAAARLVKGVGPLRCARRETNHMSKPCELASCSPARVVGVARVSSCDARDLSLALLTRCLLLTQHGLR